MALPEGTSGDMLLQLALKKAGLTMDDIEKVAMEPATIVSAFSSKQVDAAGIWYPLIDTIKAQVPDLKELAANPDFKDEMAFPTAMVTGPDYAKNNEATVVNCLKVLREAMTWRADNQDAAIALVAKMNKLDEAKVKADASNGDYFKPADFDKQTEDGTIAKWLDNMAKFYEGVGKVQNPQPASEFYLGDLWVKAGK